MNTKQRIMISAAAAVTLALLAFGAFIWPTPYRYERVEKYYRANMKVDQVYRVSRLTGEATLIIDTTPGADRKQQLEAISGNELAAMMTAGQLDFRATPPGKGLSPQYAWGRLYNGMDWSVVQVDIVLFAGQRSRQYRFHVNVLPRSSGSFEMILIDKEFEQFTSYELEAVTMDKAPQK